MHVFHLKGDSKASMDFDTPRCNRSKNRERLLRETTSICIYIFFSPTLVASKLMQGISENPIGIWIEGLGNALYLSFGYDY